MPDRYTPHMVAAVAVVSSLLSCVFPLPSAAHFVSGSHAFPHQDVLVEHDDLADITDVIRLATAATYIDSAHIWNLTVCGPIVWVDASNTEHEVDVDNASWKPWIDHLGAECVNAWGKCAGRPECPPNGSVTVNVQLMSQKRKVGKVVYKPEQGDKSAAPFSDMVSDITGISSGKPLSKVLPPDAKHATMVYFRMRFTHAVDDQKLSNE